jgi:hypothetical protein
LVVEKVQAVIPGRRAREEISGEMVCILAMMTECGVAPLLKRNQRI